jgi:hypothetical protein
VFGFIALCGMPLECDISYHIFRSHIATNTCWVFNMIDSTIFVNDDDHNNDVVLLPR